MKQADHLRKLAEVTWSHALTITSLRKEHDNLVAEMRRDFKEAQIKRDAYYTQQLVDCQETITQLNIKASKPWWKGNFVW